MSAGGSTRVDDGPANHEAEKEADEENTSKDAAKTIPLRLGVHLHVWDLQRRSAFTAANLLQWNM